ncbi:Cysteine protease atg4 [Serendipita sp. 396]|nr:Cysteine protease atg4 [Serendipita sp. 396]KAG8785481.1 Cysteine protease atg4 [Serendipita sp. 397]KAG8801033.1 Cysteine protease atg4 [Serendipita sp. 398]KAG8823904.1 Cysteine protease atg4 [Serendipita sp. 401]KAG8834464.1 Cysteine protease atg4 [Serendipita sp. 400]KAG8859972.1 Cysteine protease atg4 [Serendipita sp. 411]KAG8869361.1 Cysteine protease atg4 [Serendipita sp. 405]KAG9055131.1 Cysteine protease atg4 [Serendipita sp. 407]
MNSSNVASGSNPAPSTSPSARNLSDFSARLSGLFSHFTGSSSDLSLPNIISQSNLSGGQLLAGSPKAKTTHPLITAGKDHLGKAMRYLMDPDAQPDKSGDKIWVLGVEHPGYEPPPPPSSTPAAIVPSSPTGTLVPPNKLNHRRDSIESRNKSPSSFRSPIPNSHSNSSTQSLSSSVSSTTLTSGAATGRALNPWPQDFYLDYNSRIWLTYRNTFPPIRDTSLSSLEPVCPPCTDNSPSATDLSQPLPSPSKPRWPWSTEKGWTSDSGWGCMLRTGQSLLANALIHLHLSRSWRRPNQASFTPEFVQYVRILTWFLDTPSPLAPFGVHRMALAGKELGKEVGSWFGPSTAAGAIKRLVGEFDDAGLEVVVAVDSAVYQSDVYAASAIVRGNKDPKRSDASASRPLKKKGQEPPKWGGRPVLILVGIRLGIDGVNPIYYESVKALFTFPQTVGIAGGRPSSSYYFVGVQGDNLFYLDPHHSRPAIPLRPPPSFDETSIISTDDGQSQASSRLGKRRGSEIHLQGHLSTPDTSESEKRSSKRLSIRRASVNRMSSSYQQAIPISPSSTHSSTHSTSSFSQGSQASHSQHTAVPLSSSPLARSSISSPPSIHRPPSASPTRVNSTATIPLSPTSNGLPRSPSTSGMTPLSPTANNAPLDHLSTYLATAYSISELRTFHCEKVRKMPLSSLDPSMLLGFLCRDEEEWKDLRERVAEMAKTKKAIFSIHDEPPKWPDENGDIDIESASDQEEEDEDDEAEEESPVGGDDDAEEDKDRLEIKRQHHREVTVTQDESGEEEDDNQDLNAGTPVAPSTKIVSSRHDTIVGRARPEMAAAAAATTKANQLHDRKDSRGNDGDDDADPNDEDDDLDDDEWVDPVQPSPPVKKAKLPPTPPEKNLVYKENIPESLQAEPNERKRGHGEDTSVTPTPTASIPQPSGSAHQKSRSMQRELPAIPTTVVSMSKEPTHHRPSSSSSRRLSQVAIGDIPVPFPTRTSDHRKHSSASSRSTTSASLPTSPASSLASQHQSSSPGHSNSYAYHRAHNSGSTERDAIAYPFPGSTTDESGTTSSDSAPSSDAWGGDERYGPGTRSLVPKRERKTTVGRTAPSHMTTSSAGSVQYASSQQILEKHVPSKAKHGGRTTSGGVRAAVWKDEDGDDF